MNILFAADRGYLGPLKNCIRSIVQFPQSEGYDFYILHSDLTEKHQQQISAEFSETARFHFTLVDTSLFSRFPETDRYPKQIYYRIFAASLLPKHLDRILYLDADTLVINPLNELYEMDFEGNYFMACTHVRELLTKINMVRLSVDHMVPYINTGVMMLNLNALRANQNIKEVLEYVEKKKNAFLLPDQDIISALYGDKIKLLETERYNLSDRMLAFYNANPKNQKLDLEWVRENTVILHYCGRMKPWKKNYIGILDSFYPTN